MHVFIDTNILLNFFHFSSEDLGSLQTVFASHEYGSATVCVTKQVQDEFNRNRETKLKDALKRFKNANFTAQLPSFMKGYSEYNEIRGLASKLEMARKSMLNRADQDILDMNLDADRVIREIFKNSDITPFTTKLFEEASRRMALRNPPGKDGSLGDAINWMILLETVPNKQDLHLVSEDGDFYSKLSDDRPNPFLVDEWQREKDASLFIYRTLSEFTKKNFDGVAFSFDSGKEKLIDDLRFSGSFADTHELITKLELYSYFSAQEVERVLEAACENSQVGCIVTDHDVSDFLHRVAMPHYDSIKPDACRSILDDVKIEQGEREQE